MDIVKKMEEFASWPKEVQDVCIYHAQSRKPSEEIEPRPRLKQPPKAVPQNKHKRWSEEDRDLLFKLFDDHGWDHLLAQSWAKKFGRTVTCLRGQYDQQYAPLIRQQYNNPQEPI